MLKNAIISSQGFKGHTCSLTLFDQVIPKFSNYSTKKRLHSELIVPTNLDIQRLENTSRLHLGFLRTMITESPRRNILLMNLSLLTGSAFFFPLPVFGIWNKHYFNKRILHG